MLKYSYYPFKNDLENVDESDLILLKNVSEGWYIEYKSQGLKIPDFAKHLAAFANQYGGWLIIGISESNDGNRTAEDFKGIPNSEIDRVSRDIREASAAHISPEVLYEEKIVQGPIENIGLNADFSILIIGIPMSNNTPHIHSSGRIYRRLADQSKPKEETDRYILDELWKRGKTHQDEIIRFFRNIPELPEVQQSTPWVHIYFKPAEGQPGPKKKLTFNDFSKIIRNKNHEVDGMHAPMQAIYTTVGGYIARQTSKNNPNLALLTFRWWNDGRARLDIPLNQYDLDSFSENKERYKYSAQYCNLARELGYEDTKVVDYSILLLAAACLTNVYIHMLEHIEDDRDTYSCFTVRNVFHTSPYIDTISFINRLKNNSIPLTHERSISRPFSPTESNMFFHKKSNRDKRLAEDEFNNLRPIIFSMSVIYTILESVGVENDPEQFIEDREAWGFEHLNRSSNI